MLTGAAPGGGRPGWASFGGRLFGGVAAAARLCHAIDLAAVCDAPNAAAKQLHPALEMQQLSGASAGGQAWPAVFSFTCLQVKARYHSAHSAQASGCATAGAKLHYDLQAAALCI